MAISGLSRSTATRSVALPRKELLLSSPSQLPSFLASKTTMMQPWDQMGMSGLLRDWQIRLGASPRKERSPSSQFLHQGAFPVPHVLGQMGKSGLPTTLSTLDA